MIVIEESDIILSNPPPLSLSIYVNDFVYFSQDPEVGEAFETLLFTQIGVDFMGKFSQQRGIKFKWSHTNDGLSSHIS